MVWVAVVVATAILGLIGWSLRRRSSGGDEPAGLRREWDWESGLGPDARVAFVEGLRAGHERVSVEAERGVLLIFDPPRLISLTLLADRFTARGQEGLHDPEGTLRELVARYVADERPGVLHLRPDWLDGEIDGMDRAGFTAVVCEIVCPPEAVRYGNEAAGSVAVTVPASGDEPANTMLLDLARVLDRYRELRGERPGMPPGAVLRDVLFGLLSAGGPGLTWTRPPTDRQRTLLLSASRPAAERPSAS